MSRSRTYGRHTSSGGAYLPNLHSELRIPVARTAAAEAGKVLAHYTAVNQGTVQVKPQFWSWRIKVGLWAAVIGTASFLAGLALGSWSAVPGGLPVGMAVVGAVVAPFGLILAFLAWRIREG